LIDTIAPVISCPPDTAVVAVDSLCEYEVPDFLGDLTVTDNCTPSDSVVLTQTPSAGEVLSGDTTVVIVAMDASGNSDTCTVYLSAIDTIAPEVSGPGSITRVLDGNCSYTLEDFKDSLVVTDNCSSSFTYSYDPP